MISRGAVVLVFVACLPLVAAQNATPPRTDGEVNATATLIPTESPVHESMVKPECFTNLTLLHEFVQEKDPFIVEQYILCPNTIFEIGILDINGICCISGMAPLDPLSNTHILCGADGKSSNNCTLHGGTIQITTGTSFEKADVINVLIQGVTFAAGLTVSALLVSAGDITFSDCIFEDHRNAGVVSLYFVFEERRHLLESWDEHDGFSVSQAQKNFERIKENIIGKEEETFNSLDGNLRNRQLDDVPTSIQRQNVTFRDCIFRNNSYNAQIDQGNNGVILSESPDNDLSLEGCIFEGNLFGNPSSASDGYAVRLYKGNTVNLTNNCFINNEFIGRGTVIVAVEKDVRTRANYGSQNGKVACAFVFAEDDSKCLDYDSVSCPTGSPSPSNPSPTSGVQRKFQYLLVAASFVLVLRLLP